MTTEAAKSPQFRTGPRVTTESEADQPVKGASGAARLKGWK